MANLNGQYGIYLSLATNNNFSGNTMYSNGQYGMWASNMAPSNDPAKLKVMETMHADGGVMLSYVLDVTDAAALQR